MGEPGVRPAAAAERAWQQQCQALSYRQRASPSVARRRPRARAGTLLCPAQLPGALDSVAANALIGINSDALGIDRGPHPVGGSRELLDRPGCTDLAISHRTEHGVKFVELDLGEG